MPRPDFLSEDGSAVGITGAELRGVARIWRSTGRRLYASFDGSSMEPTIPPRTELVIRCTADVKVGDVIVFVYLDQVAVHRLVTRRRGWMLTRGDAHVIPDAPIVDRDVVIGRIESIRHESGSESVPPAPSSFARTVALSFVRLGGLFGSQGAAAASLALRFLSAARLFRRRFKW